MNHFFLILSLFFSSAAFAYENIVLELDSGIEMEITQFQGDGKTLILWLPSERGFGPGYVPVSLGLESNDYDVWITHLHESYIIPRGRFSLNQADPLDLLNLLQIAQNKGFQEVYIVSSNRGMQLALKTAYVWQHNNRKSRLLRGLISFSPHLVKGRTEVGTKAEYVGIASHSHLPIYLMQAQHSVKYAHSQEIAEQLRQGGSQTYIQLFPGVQGGFHMRSTADLTELDIATRDQLPQVFQRAIKLLRKTRIAPFKGQYNVVKAETEVSGRGGARVPELHRFNGQKKPPPLVLKNLNGEKFDLSEMGGKVVLVNFWASWCRPCVKEIPSLSRLVKGMENKPFKVVTINIGESAERIERFIQSIPVNFEILLDRKGHAVRDWKVYAYPSNFLLDKEGRIQYAYRGALEWDAPPIVETIEGLL